MSFKLTVFFEDPFWVGIFAISENSAEKYCRVVFGKEPSDIEIYRFFLQNYSRLKFSEALPVPPEDALAGNPKRRQREVGKTLHRDSSEKKSWEAAKQVIQEGKKAVSSAECRLRRIEHQQHVMQIKEAKRKEKHRGH